MVDRPGVRGAAFALLSAALFGASAPVAKLLLRGIDPLVLAGLLYLGAGAGMSAVALARRSPEAPLKKADLPWLLGVILCGGALGPALLLLGLERVSGVAGSLLLNLEAPFTIVLAVAAFGEAIGLRQAGASALIVAGAALLGFRPGPLSADPWGLLAIAGACLAWAIDNNLTRKLSLKDPVAIVRFKGLGAGACTLAVGLLAKEHLPPLAAALPALALGLLSYGVSVLLAVHALRLLGAAREAAFFATAPFVGAWLAVPLLHESLRLADLGAMAVMALGVTLLTRERHAHLHTHEALEHEHLHVHDAHHQHPHDGPVTEPHSHPHRHEPLTHEHPHLSDLHHRHRH